MGRDISLVSEKGKGSTVYAANRKVFEKGYLGQGYGIKV